jgi:hypothetical protein
MLRKLSGIYYSDSKNWMKSGYFLFKAPEFKPVESLAEAKEVDILEILPFSYLSSLLNAEVDSSLMRLLFSIKSDK